MSQIQIINQTVSWPGWKVKDIYLKEDREGMYMEKLSLGKNELQDTLWFRLIFVNHIHFLAWLVHFNSKKPIKNLTNIFTRGFFSLRFICLSLPFLLPLLYSSIRQANTQKPLPTLPNSISFRLNFDYFAKTLSQLCLSSPLAALHRFPSKSSIFIKRLRLNVFDYFH